MRFSAKGWAGGAANVYEYRRLAPEQKAEVVRERITRGFQAHAPPHLPGESGGYLLTAACYEHAPHMAGQDRRQ